MSDIKISSIKHLKKKKISKRDVKLQLSSIIKDSFKSHNIFNTFRLNNIIERNKLKKFLKFKKVVVIGMGGSVLAAKAIYNFMENKVKKKFYFIDNLNGQTLNKFSQDKKILFLIISKSGTTLETLTSISIIEKIIKKKKYCCNH